MRSRYQFFFPTCATTTNSNLRVRVDPIWQIYILIVTYYQCEVECSDWNNLANQNDRKIIQCQQNIQMIISVLWLKNSNDFFMATLLRTLFMWKFHWHARLGFFLKEKDRQRKLWCYLFEKNDITLCMTRPNGKIWHTWCVAIIYKFAGNNLSRTNNS